MPDSNVKQVKAPSENLHARIRPEMSEQSIAWRGKGMSPDNLRRIRKALLTLHTLETMAVEIYRFQITREDSELNRYLIIAMCNEMTHIQDFQVKLFEYGFRPTPLRWAYWVVGFVFGFTSRIRGHRAILKTGVWVESKAVHHYGQLLNAADWDHDTRAVIERDRFDEHGHIERWQTLLDELG
ncbi:MAG TPA: demethoxyubiquinone hydroxylase family protein [Candidatus Brocadiia bacterium]|nr:demethoxyubiquinone hydroxylase family protein [Candidatus Brocadiia bacterium]